VCGFVLAALLGAVVSSLAAMLNAASTIFAMDMYKKYLHPQASQKAVVFWGRISVIVFSVIAVVLAPALGNPKFSHSIFIVIQESQGLIEPGIVSVFMFGLLFRRAPRISGVIGLLASIIVYGGMTMGGRYNVIPEVQFLNRIAITFGICLLILLTLRVVKPLPEPIEFQHNTTIELHSSKGAMVAGVAVIIVTLILYAIFSPIGIAG
jgi:SSS family solute:Na+ symporter